LTIGKGAATPVSLVNFSMTLPVGSENPAYALHKVAGKAKGGFRPPLG
jgi:hypothetical protein